MTQPRTGTGPLSPFLGIFPSRNQAARLQHVLEQMPGAALLVVPRTGQFVALNSRAMALTGWTREELLAQALAEVVMTADALTALHAAEPGSVRQLHSVPLRTRAGLPTLVDVRLSAFADAGEVMALIQATPASERQALELEHARHTYLVNNLHQLLDLFDTPGPDSLTTALNRVAAMFSAEAAALYKANADLGGLQLEAGFNLPRTTPARLPAEAARLLTAPTVWANPQRAETPLAQVFRAAGWAAMFTQPLGKPPSVTGVLCLAYQAGSPPPTATPIYLELVARQVHQLMRQIGRQARLLDGQRLTYHLTNQLAAVQAQVTEGVLVVNQHGLVDELNPAAAQLLGYRSGDVIGLRFEDVLAGDEAVHRGVRTALAERPAASEREGEMHRRNGEAFPVVVRAQPLPAPPGGCVVVFQDLSRVRADQVHREHLDHMAYIGQSTAAFAHEVRAPLNNISMGVQYLAARLPEADPLQPALAKIQAESARLSDLMNNMLSWTRPIEPRLLPVEVPAVLERLLQRWAAKLQQRNITRSFQAPDNCPPVQADPSLIERVFVNLIENAHQAMPAGGHLAVTVTLAERGPQGTQVEVKVADSGPGIPEEHRKRIFDPYFTTKADGTGLGLAICKRIVTVHHGALNVESFPGTGTIFTVTLPTQPEALLEPIP